MRKEIIVINAVLLSRNGNPEVILARIRGDIGGKTLKIPPFLFRGDFPMQGEVWKAEFEGSKLQDAGPNYRVLRNAKLMPCGNGTAAEPQLSGDADQ